MTDNVVSIEQKQKDMASRHALARRLPDRFKEVTHKHMHRVLQGMFDNADDTLFKMAERAGGEGQDLYFDSMRIVRLQRKTIEGNFFKYMDEGFDTFATPGEAAAAEPQQAAIDYDTLELVSDTDLEVNLAIENLQHKIQARYSPELSAIQKRLGWLYNEETLALDSIPFGPGRLVNAYFQAAEAVDLQLEIKLILLKLFDWHCMQGFYELYHEINEIFIDAGVLPVIKTTIKHTAGPGPSEAGRHPVYEAPAGPGGAGAGPPGAGGAENIFDTLQSLLSRQRSAYAGGGDTARVGGVGLDQGGLPRPGPTTGYPGGAGAGDGGPGAGPVVVVSTDELMQSLTALQTDAELQMPAGGAHAVGNYVRAQMQGADGESRQLKPLDNDAIDVVCLIFEYILDDPQLPAAARASIARLQIPMLKVAMLDKQFFAMQGHPARSLLNHLAKAALGVDETDEDKAHPVLTRIDEVVTEVLERFKDDLDIFEEVDREFREFLDAYHSQEQQARREIERRQQQREELALARAWVRETLEQHLLGRTLPRPIVDIILGPWKDVMLQTYMQEGDESLLWKNQIRFIDVLCWSVAPKQLRLDRQKLGNIIRQLIVTLRQGLERIDYPPAEVEAIFATLEPYHLASVRGEDLAVGPIHSETRPRRCATSEDPPPVVEEVDTAAVGEEADPGPTATTHDDKVIMEEIVLQGWESDPVLEQIDDEYLELARHLETGKWVEFQDSQGTRRRAKLAWKSELLGEYTFLNWRFNVVADKSLQELAADLRQGSAKVVDDLPLMDRALAGVMNALTPKSG